MIAEFAVISTSSIRSGMDSAVCPERLVCIDGRPDSGDCDGSCQWFVLWVTFWCWLRVDGTEVGRS